MSELKEIIRKNLCWGYVQTPLEMFSSTATEAQSKMIDNLVEVIETYIEQKYIKKDILPHIWRFLEAANIVTKSGRDLEKRLIEGIAKMTKEEEAGPYK